MSPGDVDPNSDPIVGRDEELVDGDMQGVLLQDSTEINLDSTMEMEEILIKFLSDNVGSEDTFWPICAYISDSSHEV